jgi:putative ABC transport system ATP-binding protein
MPALLEQPAAPAGPATLAVHCRAVTKSYGAGETRVTALRGVDLDVMPGRLTMLVGPSGCGKTTLISVIAGILDRDGGECTVFGEDLARMSLRERTRFRGRNIGFVFQSFNLIPSLTAAENAAIPLLILGHGRAAALRRATEVLDVMRLADRARALPAQLSGGQQQRVAIARAMVHEPRLIVCDEPTSSLDHDTGHAIMRLLKNFALTADRALVIVTHDARIFPFADSIAQMDDGQILRVVTDPASLAAIGAPAAADVSGTTP